jgi:hypothetical protein
VNDAEYKEALEMKSKANTLFKEANFDEAAKMYL